VVFTLPQQLAPVALQNPRVIYHLLFTAAAETLITIAADRKRLGARIGFLAVLHTWNQQVMHHPHLHCLVPAGGISPDGSRWLRCRLKYFLPVKVLAKMFRGKLLDLVREAYARGKLRFFGNTKPLADRVSFDRFTMHLKEIKWLVYAKPPLDGPEHVIKYLARYTHRVAIANGRIIELADGRVTFRWRDSRDGNKQKLMTLDAVEFIRRYLLHVLPCGFVKIRRFGFLANRNPVHRSPCAGLYSGADQHRSNRSLRNGNEQSTVDVPFAGKVTWLWSSTSLLASSHMRALRRRLIHRSLMTHPTLASNDPHLVRILDVCVLITVSDSHPNPRSCPGPP
jgi:hypothetical protein